MNEWILFITKRIKQIPIYRDDNKRQGVAEKSTVTPQNLIRSKQRKKLNKILKVFITVIERENK